MKVGIGRICHLPSIEFRRRNAVNGEAAENQCVQNFVRCTIIVSSPPSSLGLDSARYSLSRGLFFAYLVYCAVQNDNLMKIRQYR
jgi:hypothetical protein